MKTLKMFFSFNMFFQLFLTLILFSIFTDAGVIYQNFDDNNSGNFGWTWNNTVAERSSEGEPVYEGDYSWKVQSSDFWSGTGIEAKINKWNFNTYPDSNDRFVFRIYALTDDESSNTVGVKFYDNGNYKANGFEVWTTNKFKNSYWTKLHVLFNQLPSDFNLTSIDKIELINYRPGTYYFDSLQFIRENMTYQSFENEMDQYGWVWGNESSCSLSQNGEPVYEGSFSWKIVLKEKWSGTGIKCQEMKYYNFEQTPWHVDLNPIMNNELIFFVYALSENGLDNNLAVELFDCGNYSSNCYTVWTKKAAKFGKWTRFSIPLSELPEDFNLRDINKIQFKFYWPGTYYIDNINAAGSIPALSKIKDSNNFVNWNLQESGKIFELESAINKEPILWNKVYEGSNLNYTIPNISNILFRVRSKEEITYQNEIPFISSWSNHVEKLNESVIINKTLLETENKLHFNAISNAEIYEVEYSLNGENDWQNVYSGTYPLEPINASYDVWYRVRASKTNPYETTNWSAPIYNYSDLQKGFLRTNNKDVIDGNGNIIKLKGVNLGSYLLLESWMCELGTNDNPTLDDDYSIRNVLIERFGENADENLLSVFQNAFIKDIDFDILSEIGINFVRLPIYYRNLMDEDFNWLLNNEGEIDFSKIDNVIKACKNRGIYVLLDLHGAPGSQSNEFHTGRKEYNKLFEDSIEGEFFREKTIKFWKGVAEYYKNEPQVLGYDILNEPIGVYSLQNTLKPHKEILWDLYNEIYETIRSVDTNHIIVMESVWGVNIATGEWEEGWLTLPNPSLMNFENIIYQFHYYCWNSDENFDAHKIYLDNIIEISNQYQNEYQIPAMVGEFTAFNLSSIWEYYLEKFNEQGWSWCIWSYKVNNPNSTWGLFTKTDYPFSLPKFRETDSSGISGDSYSVLLQKLDSFDTLGSFSPNKTLIKIISEYTDNLNSNNNHLPVAVIGGNLSYELSSKDGSNISLNGNASYDIDNDEIEDYIWTTSLGVFYGESLSIKLPFGYHQISLRVFDGKNYSNEVSVIVEIKDSVSPSLNIYNPYNGMVIQSYYFGRPGVRIIYSVNDFNNIVFERAELNGVLVTNGQYVVLSPGTNYTLRITVKDAAGNTTEKYVNFRTTPAPNPFWWPRMYWRPW